MTQDGVYKMSLSPDGSLLAVVHHSGLFSLWDVPSLRMKNHWKLEDQPGFDEINPEVADNPTRRKQMKGTKGHLPSKAICRIPLSPERNFCDG